MLTPKRHNQLKTALKEAAMMIQDELTRERFLDIAEVDRVDGVPNRHATRLVEHGASVSKIANEIGCSESTVRRWIRRKQRTK